MSGRPWDTVRVPVPTALPALVWTLVTVDASTRVTAIMSTSGEPVAA
jgi:hypothetical protein